MLSCQGPPAPAARYKHLEAATALCQHNHNWSTASTQSAAGMMQLAYEHAPVAARGWPHQPIIPLPHFTQCQATPLQLSVMFMLMVQITHQVSGPEHAQNDSQIQRQKQLVPPGQPSHTARHAKHDELTLLCLLLSLTTTVVTLCTTQHWQTSMHCNRCVSVHCQHWHRHADVDQ